MNNDAEGRMVTLPEIITRSGLSRSYFYNYKHVGKLSLPLVKVAGKLQCKESDFEEWLQHRHVLTADRMDQLIEELSEIVSGIKDDPGLYPAKYPETFSLFTERLQGALVDVADRIKLERSIPFGEYLERFRAIAGRIEAGFLEGLPAHAQYVFSLAFSEPVLAAHSLLFDFLKSEYRKWFRDHISMMLSKISGRQWQSQDEKIEDVKFYLSEEEWLASGFSEEERGQMIRAAIADPDVQQEVNREDS